MSEANELRINKDLNPANQQRGLQTRDRRTHVERILEWYHLGDRGEDLTEDEEVYRQRMIMAWDAQCKGYPRKLIVNKLVKHFGISERTAHSDIRDSTKLFGEVGKADKEGLRQVATQMALRLYRFGERNKNENAMDRGLAKFIRINRLEHDDPEMPDFSKLKQHLYAFILDEKSQQALEMLTKQTAGPINLSEMYDKIPVEDVDAEEITDAE